MVSEKRSALQSKSSEAGQTCLPNFVPTGHSVYETHFAHLAVWLRTSRLMAVEVVAESDVERGTD